MKKVDPIDVAIVQNNLIAAANEMRRTMMRTAFDPVIYEVLDFGCAILDNKTQILAQGLGLALFIGSLGMAVKNCVDHIGEKNLDPGDVFVAAGHAITGSHPPDAIVAAPIFYKGKLFGYAASKAHWLDLGAKEPYPTDSTNIFQEGLRLPPVKLYKKGVLQNEIKEIIQWNSRAPYQIWGDIQSQIAAIRAAQARITELLDKFGFDYTYACIEEMYDHGERVARAAIKEMPDGTWSAEDYLDDDGVDKNTPVKLKVSLTIKGDEMIIDFTGSAKETVGPVNCSFITTKSIAGLIMKALTTPRLPAHDGCLRPLTVIAPPGTIFNPGPLTPSFLYGWPALQAVDMLNRVLAEAVPDKVPAPSGGDLCGVLYYGIHPRTGRFWAEACPHPIGMGADLKSDGETCLLHHAEGGTRNVPIEVKESRDPLMIERYEIRQDSGGPGRNRGGLGMIRQYRFLADGYFLAVIERGKFPHWGVHGGQPGARNFGLAKTKRKGEFEFLKTSEVAVDAGDVIINHTGGGGGWGDPKEREPERVLADVIGEYVSLEAARRDYGVAIKKIGEKYVIDQAETARLRAKA